MIKLTTCAVVAMGVLSSTSYANSGLNAIYADPTYDWDYYVENGVNDIDSTKIDDIRLFKVGDYYWTTIYDNKTDPNSAYKAVFKSKVSDGIDGIYAVSRNSGYRWGVNKILAGLEEELGSKYFVYTPITDGEGHEWSWEYDWGLKASDWLKENQNGRFVIPDYEQTSNFSAAYSYDGGVGSYVNNSLARIYGTQYVVDPDSTTHEITYDQTVYEDGYSYGYVSVGEIRSMVNQIAGELTESAFEAGWDAGYDAGYNAGYEDGFNDGYEAAIIHLK